MAAKRRHQAQPKTKARNFVAAERRAKAVALRREGKTFPEIGKILGFSPQRAHKIISETLDHLNVLFVADAAELRQQQLDQIAALKEALWKAGKRGELGKVDRLVKLMDREAKLAGLDAPDRHELTGKDGKPLEVSAVRTQLVAKLKGLAGKGT